MSAIAQLLAQQQTPIEPGEACWLAAGCLATQLVRGTDEQAAATRDVLDWLEAAGFRLPLLNLPAPPRAPVMTSRSMVSVGSL